MPMAPSSAGAWAGGQLEGRPVVKALRYFRGYAGFRCLLGPPSRYRKGGGPTPEAANDCDYSDSPSFARSLPGGHRSLFPSYGRGATLA
jgi:hypothetical protein